MKPIVVSIGGSVIFSIDVSLFRKLVTLLLKLSTQMRIWIVVGGGRVAREYITLGRKLKLDEIALDWIGIEATRLNARLLTGALGISDQEIPSTTTEALQLKNPIVVMGGTTPGHSTDMVAAELAEKARAERLIIATDVDGVFDKDPKRYPDAKQLKEVSIHTLIKLYGTEWKKAGDHIVIDGPALEVIARSHIPVSVVNGKRLDQLERAMTSQSFQGTKITV
jgi:uridylate kinase